MKIIYVDSPKYGRKEVLVDDEDYIHCIQWNWSVHWNGGTFYVVRSIKHPVTGKSFQIKLHRFILGVTDPEIDVDHKDFNGLNNQKSNIRESTSSQNCINRRKRENLTSKYKGVCYLIPYAQSKNSDGTIKKSFGKPKWKSSIRVNGKKKHLAYFDNEEDAARAYDEAAKKYHGEFAVLNFAA